MACLAILMAGGSSTEAEANRIDSGGGERGGERSPLGGGEDGGNEVGVAVMEVDEVPGANMEGLRPIIYVNEVVREGSTLKMECESEKVIIWQRHPDDKKR